MPYDVTRGRDVPDKYRRDSLQSDASVCLASPARNVNMAAAGQPPAVQTSHNA